MKFKIIAQIDGEPKARQRFEPDRKSAGIAVSQLLNDPTVPIGTVVEIYEQKEELVQRYEKVSDRMGVASGSLGKMPLL